MGALSLGGVLGRLGGACDRSGGRSDPAGEALPKTEGRSALPENATRPAALELIAFGSQTGADDPPGAAMERVYLTSAVRTPIGRFLGAFADTTAIELGRIAARAAIQRSGDPAVDLCLFGCARQAGLGPNPARQVSIFAGLPETVPAITLNMACGSGLLAILDGTRRIRLGEAEVVLAGGMENMTRVPHLLPGARMGYRLGHGTMVDGMYQDGFHCPLADQLMGETAETLARQYGISRTEQDEFAARSQADAARSIENGAFAAELVSVPLRDRRGQESLVAADEHPRPGTTVESLGALPAVFDRKSGTVTAGNSSGITDGAAAVVLMSERALARSGQKPLAEILGFAEAGVDPRVMGLGPVPAVRRLLDSFDWKLSDFDLVELNEAFAAQVLACLRELPIDRERLNVCGGSIALGHPIGATGARIVGTLAHALRARGGSLGLATLCISGGQGLALALRACP